MWSGILYQTSNAEPDELAALPHSEEEFTRLVAGRLLAAARDPLVLNSFSELSRVTTETETETEPEQDFWYQYALQIPVKLNRLTLLIREFDAHCRTCIISEQDIASLVRYDTGYFCHYSKKPRLTIRNQLDRQGKDDGQGKHFRNIVSDWNRFFIEMNYLIPVVLKSAGFEIIRRETEDEIGRHVTDSLARAIHSKYLRTIKGQQGAAERNHNPEYPVEYASLPADIKSSNYDNACHIPTKLLAIGYRIRPVRKGFKPLSLQLTAEEVETMAKIEHIRWSWDKRLNGWRYGRERDDRNKIHPALVPYNELPETEKDKDRELVKLIPSLLIDIDYEAYPIDPRNIRHLSYALKPQSIVHKILNETRELNTQIRALVTLSPEIDQMVMIRNRKIEQAINEIEESYNYAQRIQENFLPADLYVRELFPDSFILYKPKDIVSGDFYFFSRHENQIFLAVADCTGHGIPGALLSTIGYGILDQAVNEKRLTDPSLILLHLYTKIHGFLKNDSAPGRLLDDLDIILCVFEPDTNTLRYSGVKNSLYHITGGTLLEYKARNTPDEYNAEGDLPFVSESITVEHGDCIYLFTDGYVDQFGGKYHRKFLSGRLKSLLLSINALSMTEQSDRLYEEFERWKEENHEDQTDDVLGIGIRI